MNTYYRNLSNRTKSNLNRSNSKLAEATKRLSSGYRINSAADDAAGLAISEKLRSIDRGLRQGVRNTSDGLNFLDTVDGSAQEINNMLHRLKELAVQSANGTYDEIDRQAMDLEYQQLLEEINQITDTAHFNELPLYEQHWHKYELDEGFVEHIDPVEINSKNDTLLISYTINDKSTEASITLPHGTYSAEQLADLVDTELFNDHPNLIIGVNEKRQFTMQCETGHIDYIGGSGASLFYDTILGNSNGYLKGVTTFANDTTAEIPIIADTNDAIQFRIGNTDDTLYSVKLNAGYYTRPQLIDHINQKFSEIPYDGGTLADVVEAIPDENSDGKLVVSLTSKSTITGLAGNFLMMDGIPSPIYDINTYTNLNNTEATFNGKKVIQSNTEIERGRNDYFVLDVSYYVGDDIGTTEKIKVSLLDDGENLRSYGSASDIVARIKEQLAPHDLPIKVEATSDGRIKMSTTQYGDKCKIKLDTSDVPSGHMVYDLFDSGSLNRVAPSSQSSYYSPAKFQANKALSDEIVISSGFNELTFNIDYDTGTDTTIHFTIPEGTYTRSALQTELNNQLAANYPDIADTLKFTVGSSLSLKADGMQGVDVKKITAVEDTAYSRLIHGPDYIDNYTTKQGTETVLVSYTTTMPNGSATTSAASGKTTEGETYSDVYNSSTIQDDKPYFIPTPNKPDIIPGKTTNNLTDSSVGDNTVTRTPAVMTLPNALTRFTVDGVSPQDTTLNFTYHDRFDGQKDYNIVIPKGSTAAEAIQQIQTAVGDKIAVTQSGSNLVLTTVNGGEEYKFDNVGGTIQNSLSINPDVGKANAVADKANNKVYVPATYTMGSAYTNIPYTATADNDRFVINSGTTTYDITLAHKTYNSLSDIAAELNSKMAAIDGGTAKTTVSVKGSSLVITGDPRQEGSSINIGGDSTATLHQKKTVNNVESSPYYNPATGKAEQPATLTAKGVSSHLPLTVDSSNNTVTMSYTHPIGTDPSPTTTENITLTLADGTYNSAQDLTDAINEAIANNPSAAGNITASYNSSGLTFTTAKGGSGYKLTNLGGTSLIHQYKKTNSTSGGGVADPDTNSIAFPASITNSEFDTLFTGDGLEINDTNNFAALKINGADYQFTIPNGIYTDASQLITVIENGLSGAGVDITYSGGSLKMTTDAKGASAKIEIGSANTSPIFKRAQMSSAPSVSSRSESRCMITGKNSISTIEIKDYYNQMEFTYQENGVTAKIDVTIPPKTYTASELAEAIQASIDSTIPDKFEVSVVNGCIRIKGADISDTRGFSNFSGRLFDRVFQNVSYSGENRHSEISGTTSGSEMSYIVGRNKMEPQTEEELESGKNVIIYTGINDSLVFDFTHDGITHKVELQIPAGLYNPEEIAAAVEEKGREAISKLTDANGNPIPAQYFRATIGLDDLGIGENDILESPDKLALSYILPKDGSRKEARAIIDGIRGNAAYRIFYDATSSPSPSRVIGKADLSNGIDIISGKNDGLTIYLDDEPYSITIPAGHYSCQELTEYLNTQLEEQDSLLRTVDVNGKLMIYTTENGAYNIHKISGSGSDEIFYGAEKREDDEEIGIHWGRRTNTYIWYDKMRVDEHLMRINTTGIDSMERAHKAISRLDYANRYLLHWRTLNGAQRNRTEFTEERNVNTIENLQNADAAIRDADIASEVANAAKQKILLQAQQYMLSKDKEIQTSVLDVLG